MITILQTELVSTHQFCSSLHYYFTGEVTLPNDNSTVNQAGKCTSILFFFTLLFYRRRADVNAE